MRTIVVDDEDSSREITLYMAESINMLECVTAFATPTEAIEYMEKDPVDLAILDIQMPLMDGIELGHRLREINPNLLLIYTTSSEKHALDAFKLHVAAYLLKPIRQEDMRYAVESAMLLARRHDKKIYARTFGYFDLFIDGKPMLFKSVKAKELLALLIDRRGGTVTTDQIISILWENRPNDEGTQSLCSKIVKTLQKELDEYGIGDILIQKRGVRSIDINRIRCDMYDFMNGSREKECEFLGDYMLEYSWAEERIGSLWRKANLKK